MMNFFEPKCQEPEITTSEFGICDDLNGQVAYTDRHNISKWIAVVRNKTNEKLIFTAIDKCIIKDSEEPGRGRCDAMLTTKKHLILIELKNQDRNWKTHAISQLESTIQFLINSHDISEYKYKKAFACNKSQPRFQEIDNEQNLRFFRKYGFRLDVQTEIIIIA